MKIDKELRKNYDIVKKQKVSFSFLSSIWHKNKNRKHVISERELCRRMNIGKYIR